MNELVRRCTADNRILMDSGSILTIGDDCSTVFTGGMVDV